MPSERVRRAAPRNGAAQLGTDRAAARVLQPSSYRPSVAPLDLRKRDGRRDGERPSGEVIGESGVDVHVGEVRAVGRVQVDLAVQARVPPLVLVFDVGSIRPAHDHCSQ